MSNRLWTGLLNGLIVGAFLGIVTGEMLWQVLGNAVFGIVGWVILGGILGISGRGWRSGALGGAIVGVWAAIAVGVFVVAGGGQLAEDAVLLLLLLVCIWAVAGGLAGSIRGESIRY